MYIRQSSDGIVYIDDSIRFCETNVDGISANGSEYSDRLWRRNPELFSELVKKHFKDPGQSFYYRSDESIQNFLRDYLNKQDLILVEIRRYENASNGFPYWHFLFHYNKEQN